MILQKLMVEDKYHLESGSIVRNGITVDLLPVQVDLNCVTVALLARNIHTPYMCIMCLVNNHSIRVLQLS